MIDIVKGMEKARNELLTYSKDILDADSYIWLRKLLSDFNRITLREDNYEFTVKIWPLYKNCVKFFKEYCSNVTPGSILVTFYISALELGVRKVGDSVETLAQFVDEVDMEDWDQMSVESARMFDMRTSELLICDRFGAYEGTIEIFAGGLHTMVTLDYII